VLGSSSRLKYLTPRHKRHKSSATIVAQAWVSSGASPGVTNPTRMCTSLGAGLRRPTKPPRLHLDAPQRENDNSRTCVGALDHLLRRHKNPKEVILLGRWATQADEHSKSSPSPLHKHHEAKMTTAARAWASQGASQGADKATRRWISLGAGLLRPTKSPRPHPDAPQHENDDRRSCAEAHRRHPERQERHRDVYLLGCWASPADQTSTFPLRRVTTRKRQQPQCVGESGRQPRRHKRHKEVCLLGYWAPRADQTPMSSPPLRHDVKVRTDARTWVSLGAIPGAANFTRRCSSLGAGLHRPTKPPSRHHHFATTRKRRKAHGHGRAWAPIHAPQAPQGGYPLGR